MTRIEPRQTLEKAAQKIFTEPKRLRRIENDDKFLANSKFNFYCLSRHLSER